MRTTVFATIATLFLRAASGPTPPRGILVVTAEDLGLADDVSHDNNVTTPNLARLAAEGVSLAAFYQEPACVPARTALLTGLAPARLLGKKCAIISRRLVTLPALLNLHGYSTRRVGVLRLAEVEGRHTAGDCIPGWSFEATYDSYVGLDSEPRVFLNFDFEGNEGSASIRELAATGKWFVSVHFRTHLTLEALPATRRTKKPRSSRREMVIENLDENLGKLLGEIDDFTLCFFLSDNGSEGARTSPALSSNREHGVAAISRAPAFIRWPAGGVLGGGVVRRVASIRDVFPTVAEAIGMPIDGLLLGHHLDGISFLDATRGYNTTTDLTTRTLVWQSDLSWSGCCGDKDDAARRRKRRRGAVQEGSRWRAYLNARMRIVELFDIETDPREQENVLLSSDIQRRAVVLRLRAAVERELLLSKPVLSWNLSSAAASSDIHQCEFDPHNMLLFADKKKAGGGRRLMVRFTFELDAATRWHARGIKHAEAGRYDLAIGSMSRALRLLASPEDKGSMRLAAQCHFVLGWVHQLRQEWAGARRYYEHAVAADETFVDARTNLGVVLDALGAPSMALRIMKSAFDLADSSTPRDEAKRASLLRNVQILEGRTMVVDAQEEARFSKVQSTYGCQPLPGDPSLRMLPTILVASAPKTGSTSLVADLLAHPQIVGATCKETRFWPIDHRENASFALLRYRALFPTRADADVQGWRAGVDGGLYGRWRSIRGGAPAQVAALMPKVTRVVGVLRDPVARFISVWVGAVARDDLEATCGKFYDAALDAVAECRGMLACEREREAAPLADGIYVSTIRQWNAALGPERTLWLPHGALHDDADRVLQLVARFAGVQPYGQNDHDKRPSTVAPIGSNNLRDYRDPAASRFFRAAVVGASDDDDDDDDDTWRCDERRVGRFYQPWNALLAPELLARDRDLVDLWLSDPWFCEAVAARSTLENLCRSTKESTNLLPCNHTGPATLHLLLHEFGAVHIQSLDLTEVSSLRDLVSVVRPQFERTCGHVTGITEGFDRTPPAVVCLAELVSSFVTYVVDACSPFGARSAHPLDRRVT